MTRHMVKKHKPYKTSRTERRIVQAYTVRSEIGLFGYIPQDVKMADGVIEESKQPWSVPPHVALANLPTRDADGIMKMKPEPGLVLDAKAADKFIREYGVFQRTYPRRLVKRDSQSDYRGFVPGRNIASDQQVLRNRWMRNKWISPSPIASFDAKTFHKIPFQ